MIIMSKKLVIEELDGVRVYAKKGFDNLVTSHDSSCVPLYLTRNMGICDSDDDTVYYYYKFSNEEFKNIFNSTKLVEGLCYKTLISSFFSNTFVKMITDEGSFYLGKGAIWDQDYNLLSSIVFPISRYARITGSIYKSGIVNDGVLLINSNLLISYTKLYSYFIKYIVNNCMIEEIRVIIENQDLFFNTLNGYGYDYERILKTRRLTSVESMISYSTKVGNKFLSTLHLKGEIMTVPERLSQTRQGIVEEILNEVFIG